MRYRYPVEVEGMWGYIDVQGKIAISPQFYAASVFSEGCAAVRKGGYYGFIDTTGNEILPFVYSYAQPFVHGIAKVYVDDKPYFIDRSGNRLFEHSFHEMEGFDTLAYCTVKTSSGWYGVIDKRGKVVVDTIYCRDIRFNGLLAIVRDTAYKLGVVDVNGKVVVQFGKYREISSFVHGYALCYLPFNDTNRYADHEAIIDSTGKEYFILPCRRMMAFILSPEMYEGHIVTRHYPQTDSSSWDRHGKERYGITTCGGETILLADTTVMQISPLHADRMFLRRRYDCWQLMDSKGTCISQDTFSAISYDSYRNKPSQMFLDSIEFVETGEGWRVIDIDGHYRTKLCFTGVQVYCVGRYGSTVAFRTGYQNTELGYWDSKHDIVVKPRFSALSYDDLGSGNLVYASCGDTSGYINPQGSFVWYKLGAKEKLLHGAKLNLDTMMLPDWCEIKEKFPKETKLYQPDGSCREPVPGSPATLSEHDSLIINVHPDCNTLWRKDFAGIEGEIINRGKDTAWLDAHLDFHELDIQAQDSKGKWKDITCTIPIWCGSYAYSPEYVAPKGRWRFVMPVFVGAIPTKMRVRLTTGHRKEFSREAIWHVKNRDIYSNEFTGCINPGQLWRKTEKLWYESR